MWKRGPGALVPLIAVVASILVTFPSVDATAQSYTLGIDVSHWQEEDGNTINWQKVADSGHVFAWHKATEGATYSDPRYAGNRSDAAGVGIPFGAYHFARPNGATIAAAQADAVAEAQHFLDVAQPVSGDLIPVLDLESSGGIPGKRLIAWTQAWLDHVTDAVGARALIYSGPYFWKTYMNNTATFADQGFPLWIAHYTSDAQPDVPASNWGGNGWSFWQWTSRAKVPGIVGGVDENRFAGTDLTPFKVPGGPLPEPSPDPATPPIGQGAPSISGDTEVGATLQASSGTWGGSQPQSYSYSWYRCDPDGLGCTGIEDGGTGPTYRLRPADFGHRMKVTVTATNSAGSASQDSAPTEAITDTTPPLAPRITSPVDAATLAPTVEVAWSPRGPGTQAYDVRYRRSTRDAGFGDYVEFMSGTAATQTSLPVDEGATYCLSARAVDEADNRSVWSEERCTAVPLDDRALTASSAWRRATGSAFYAGTVTRAGKQNATVVARNVRVRDIYVVAKRCPGCGKVAVFFNDKRVAMLGLRSSVVQNQALIHATGFAAPKTGTIKLVIVSDGDPVPIDGLLFGLRS